MLFTVAKLRLPILVVSNILLLIEWNMQLTASLRQFYSSPSSVFGNLWKRSFAFSWVLRLGYTLAPRPGSFWFEMFTSSSFWSSAFQFPSVAQKHRVLYSSINNTRISQHRNEVEKENTELIHFEKVRKKR